MSQFHESLPSAGGNAQSFALDSVRRRSHPQVARDVALVLGGGGAAARLPRPDWPDRPMMVTAIDAHTGELAAFDRDSGVDLVDAVTASCAQTRILRGTTPARCRSGPGTFV